MATIKAVSSRASIGRAIDYVTKNEKTDEKLISGLNCEPATVKEEMEVTKLVWRKTDGRTYKHFVQSFHKDEDITPEQAHEIAIEFAERSSLFKGFEVLIATHKDREHIHTHFIVNSVSYEDGHKFRMKKTELQDMKELSDEICSQRGLHICEKGKSFDGEEREETSAYTKETYQILKKAERGEVKSYVQEIALAVLECKEQASSREDFIQKMSERGYGVDWQDNHKYITFTDLEREKQGEKQCKIRNNKLEKYYNIEFSKEEFERGFEVNVRSTEAREQLAVNRGTEPTNNRAGTDNLGAFIANINAQVRGAEIGNQERDAERGRLDFIRQQEIAIRERAAREREERERKIKERRREKSQEYDIEI